MAHLKANLLTLILFAWILHMSLLPFICALPLLYGYLLAKKHLDENNNAINFFLYGTIALSIAPFASLLNDTLGTICFIGAMIICLIGALGIEGEFSDEPRSWKGFMHFSIINCYSISCCCFGWWCLPWIWAIFLILCMTVIGIPIAIPLFLVTLPCAAACFCCPVMTVMSAIPLFVYPMPFGDD